jgi:predicted Ser/Thr protein kinase
MTDNVKLLSSNKYPSVLIKMQRNSRERHVTDEMEREAAIYSELMENTDVKKAIAVFHGFSTHLGVPILCLGLEGPDFEDIGAENLPHELKVSAVESLQLLSQAGLLHHDLALRNIVQSKENPKQAKIIDFGRAEFTEDRHLLQKQVEFLKSILEIGEYSRSEALPSVLMKSDVLVASYIEM